MVKIEDSQKKAEAKKDKVAIIPTITNKQIRIHTTCAT